MPSLPSAAINACKPLSSPSAPPAHSPPADSLFLHFRAAAHAAPSYPRTRARSVVLYETMTRFVLRLCSHLPHRTAPTPVSSVTTIIDFDQVSLALLWSLRAHLQEASTLATANYPETLSTIAVVNTPAFFPTVWGWIKVRPPPPFDSSPFASYSY